MSEALYDKEVKCPVCDMKFKTKKSEDITCEGRKA